MRRRMVVRALDRGEGTFCLADGLTRVSFETTFKAYCVRFGMDVPKKHCAKPPLSSSVSHTEARVGGYGDPCLIIYLAKKFSFYPLILLYNSSFGVFNVLLNNLILMMLLVFLLNNI
jgi:hypothetical protein